MTIQPGVPHLRIVHVANPRPHRWNDRPPVAACLASASRGEFWRHLDGHLIAFLETQVRGAPLAVFKEGGSDAAAAEVVEVIGTCHSLAPATVLGWVLDMPSGKSGESLLGPPETWSDRVSEHLYHWVDSWISSCIGPCSRDLREQVRERVIAALEPLHGCEGTWLESRRRLTFMQIRGLHSRVHANLTNS
ncbi:MAG: hypothetical protein A2579_12345 [Lysobacterales bacterium RIFOXYD1_FULL_69_11]|nr:MAG: hypothetical protein A2579_12345 [Xanthomonadales bacterium RIFOXYD1_FULL_69_11]